MNNRLFRGDVWWVDFEPVKGHEQGETRPALIVSHNQLNSSPAELVIVVPLTTKEKRYKSVVRIPKGQLASEKDSFVLCDQIRAISTDRLKHKIGSINRDLLDSVSDVLFTILGLESPGE